MSLAVRKGAGKETVRHARHLSDVQLARMGVVFLSKEDHILQCMSCGQTWTLGPDRRTFGLDNWLCPNQCNREFLGDYA